MSVVAAQALLSYLEAMEVTAVICGGYARDTYCGKPIRDVDLYVAEDDFWKCSMALFGIDPNTCVANVHTDEDSVEYKHQSIVRQFEHQLCDDLDFGLPTRLVNLVGVNSGCTVTVAEITSRYNLGICQIGIDKDGMAIMHATFMRDYLNAHITLLRTDWGHEATMKQYLKLQAKYPWPLRVRKQEDLF